MPTIELTEDIFARIWAQREGDETSEDEILRRLLPASGTSGPDEAHAPAFGFIDRRYNVKLPQGFEIFRTFYGHEYRAVAKDGQWTLLETGERFGTLNALSKAIGAQSENAWRGWRYRAANGEVQPISALRDPSSIARPPRRETARKDAPPEPTWREIVAEALADCENGLWLHMIYERAAEIADRAGKPRSKSFESVVRLTLEENSSDSAIYRGHHDLFTAPEGIGAGVWALRTEEGRETPS